MYLVGGGGHALSVSEVASTCGYKIAGVVDVSSPKLVGVDWIEESEFIKEKISWGTGRKKNGVIAIGTRRSCYERRPLIRKFEKVLKFVSLISPKAAVAMNVMVGHGTVVMPGSTIRISSKIGDHVIINTNATVDHECVVGDNCHIAPGAILCGEVELQDDVFIGAGAVVFPGVRISAGTTIPAQARIKSSC